MCLVSVTFRYPLYCFDGSGASQPGNDWISSAAACAVAGGAVIASADTDTDTDVDAANAAAATTVLKKTVGIVVWLVLNEVEC